MARIVLGNLDTGAIVEILENKRLTLRWEIKDLVRQTGSTPVRRAAVREERSARRRWVLP